MSRARATEDQTLGDPIPIPSVVCMIISKILVLSLISGFLLKELEFRTKAIGSFIALVLIISLGVLESQLIKMEAEI